VKNLPTPEQLAEFDGYLKKWQGLLGMYDWRVYRSTKPPAKSAALHELLHSFLAELVHVSKTSKDWNLRMNAEHRIIHTLVRLLVPADK
jgi:hypothetical protein